jgi:hypothetical protein
VSLVLCYVFCRGLRCTFILETLNGSWHHRDLAATWRQVVARSGYGTERNASVYKSARTQMSWCGRECGPNRTLPTFLETKRASSHDGYRRPQSLRADLNREMMKGQRSDCVGVVTSTVVWARLDDRAAEMDQQVSRDSRNKRFSLRLFGCWRAMWGNSNHQVQDDPRFDGYSRALQSASQLRWLFRTRSYPPYTLV